MWPHVTRKYGRVLKDVTQKVPVPILQASVTCAVTGPIQVSDERQLRGSEGKEVFSEGRSGLQLFKNKVRLLIRPPQTACPAWHWSCLGLLACSAGHAGVPLRTQAYCVKRLIRRGAALVTCGTWGLSAGNPERSAARFSFVPLC